jgi:hypothetical protein
MAGKIEERKNPIEAKVRHMDAAFLIADSGVAGTYEVGLVGTMLSRKAGLNPTSVLLHPDARLMLWTLLVSRV